MIAAGVLASIPPSSWLGRNLRAGFLGALAFMAVYFLLCLRLTYFKEWYWQADTQKTYAVLSCLNRDHQVTHVTSTWEYRGPLNFYQAAEPNSIQEINDIFDPQKTQVYVVDTYHSIDALEGKDLKIFYRSPTTDWVLAARAPLADAYAAGTCLRL
jgi:predicted ferric reductase